MYPISFTCFESLAWSISGEHVNKMNDHYELWSKAGATPNHRVSNPEEYIIGFNWVNNWMNNYFFNKVSDFFRIVFYSFNILGLFRNSKKKIVKEN